jgi:hypothetical protein
VSRILFFSSDLYAFGRTPWMSDRPVARHLPKYRTTRTQNKRTHTHTHTKHPCPMWDSNDHSVRASENSSCLRQLGYRDRFSKN